MTEHKKASKSFLKYFLITSLFFLFVIGLITYWIDPFMQFRITDNQYLLNPRLVNPGLVKNYDYNTVVIGSSMVQNFDLNILRRKGKTEPLKLASGGLNVTETLLLHSLVNKEKAETIIMSIDPPPFNLVEEPNLYPSYLCGNGILDKLNYLYGYESFVRYVPVDFALKAYAQFDTLPPYFLEKSNIENIGNFKSEMTSGFDAVKNLYLQGNTVKYQRLGGMVARMTQRFDYFESCMKFNQNPNIQYIIILPPYSALYWRITKEKNYYDRFKYFVEYLTFSLSKYPNVRIALFYDIDEIVNLDNYFDVTHYIPTISDKILENIDNPVYTLDTLNINRRLAKLDSLVVSFEKQNHSWLYKK